MGDLRQSVTYKKHLKNLGWKVDNAAGTHVFIKRLPFFGSFAKIQRPRDLDLEAIAFSIRTNKARQIIVEPASKEQETRIKDQGFKISKSPYLPSKTLHLNLNRPLNYLYESLKKDARYSLRKNKDTKVYAVDKVSKFRKSWKQAAGLRRFVPSSAELESLINSFGQNSLFLVTPGGETGAIFLHAGNTAYYWQAFSNEIGRQNLYQYKILWSGISWAKQTGAKIFDFEGIYDERFPNKKWKGFTHFKKSFGGYEVEYPGAYYKFLLPLRRKWK